MTEKRDQGQARDEGRAGRGGLECPCNHWPGRYFFFTTDERVSAPPEDWKP